MWPLLQLLNFDIKAQKQPEMKLRWMTHDTNILILFQPHKNVSLILTWGSYKTG